MRLSLIPRKNIFFTQFSQHAQNSLDLQEFMLVPAGAERFSDALRIAVEVFQTLRAVLHERGLATGVGDEVSELVQLYKVRAIRPAAVRQAQALVSATTEMVKMMGNLEGLKDLEQHWIKLHTFENEGDQIFRDAMGELFANETNAIEIIKWKDIHQLIETALDRCEDVANIVETIKIKHS